MNLAEFRTKIKIELQNGEKRIAYMHIKNQEVCGGMCYSKDEALLKCEEIIKSPEYDKNSELNIAVYKDNEIEILGTSEILLSLNLISMIEYLSATTTFCG